MTTTVLAYDCSSSTTNCFDYHEITKGIADKLPSDTVVLMWNTSVTKCDLTRLREWNNKLMGDGGTQPSCIVPHLKSYPSVRLILITDGQVYTSDIEETDNKMLSGDVSIESAEIHIIGYRANTSVSCPFTRGWPHKIYEYGRQDEPVNVKQVDGADFKVLELIEELKTVDEIEAKLPSIERAVAAKMVGRATPDTKLANAIISMRRRLVQDLATRKSKMSTTDEFIEAVRTGNGTLEAMDKLNKEYFYVDSVDIESRVNRLLEVVQNCLLRQAFRSNDIKQTMGANTRRMDRTNAVEVKRVEELPETDDATSECPISMTDESDMLILIKDGTPLFDTLDTKTVDALMNCPLNALKDENFMQSLRNRVDHVISMSSYLSLGKKNISPYSRSKIIGVISLSRDSNHVKTTNWTMSRMLVGEAKRPGNLDLWYAVLAFGLESVERLQDYQSLLKENLVWRLKNHSSFASLTGLSNCVTTRLPLDVCCWYVLHSCHHEDSLGTFLMHLSHMEAIEKLVTLAGLQLNVTDKLKHIRIRVHMLTWAKKNHSTFLRTMDALRWGIAKRLDGTWMIRDDQIVFLEAAPSAEQIEYILDTFCPSFYKDVSLDILIELAKDFYSNSNVYISTEEYIKKTLHIEPKPMARPIPTRWSTADLEPWKVQICLNTCRPYYQVTPTKIWKDSLQEVIGDRDINGILSLNKLFEVFLIRYDRYPDSPEDFVWFLASKHERLPKNILAKAASTLEDYNEVMLTIPLAECVKRMNQSCSIKDRIRMEASPK